MRNIATTNKNQHGFHKGKSTTEPICCLRMIQEKFSERNRPLHLVFVDLEKAYDTISRELIWHCLQKRGIPEKRTRIIKDTYKDSTTRVSTVAGKMKEINIGVRLHQGSVLSPLLLIIIMDEIAEDIVWAMLFADDLVLCDVNSKTSEHT